MRLSFNNQSKVVGRGYCAAATEIFMHKEGYFCFLVLQASGFGKEKVLHEPLGGHCGLEVVIRG